MYNLYDWMIGGGLTLLALVFAVRFCRDAYELYRIWDEE